MADVDKMRLYYTVNSDEQMRLVWMTRRIESANFLRHMGDRGLSGVLVLVLVLVGWDEWDRPGPGTPSRERRPTSDEIYQRCPAETSWPV